MEALGGVLEHDLGVRSRRQLSAQPCATDSKLGDAGAVETEDDAALRDRRRVVEMHDRALRAGDRLEAAFDELRPRLRQHGDRRLARDELLLDQEPHEVEVRPGRSRKADLDLGNSECEQQREEPLLARAVHRVDQRLVAVSEVRRAPGRGRVDDTIGPRAIAKIDGRVWTVLPMRHGHRAALLRSAVDAPRVRTERICRRVASPTGEGRARGRPAHDDRKKLRGRGWSRGHDRGSVAESPDARRRRLVDAE